MVSVPVAIAEELKLHLAQFVDAAPAALVFTGPKGAPIRRGNRYTSSSGRRITSGHP